MNRTPALGLVVVSALAVALAACGGGGGGGGGSTPAPAAPVAPTDPSGLTATPTSSQIDLSWTDTSATETGFDVERAPDAAGSPGAWSALPGSPLAADTISISDTAPTLLADYWYRVRAFNAVGPSDWIQAGPVATLPASGELIATFGTGGVVTDDTDNRINDMASDGAYLYTAGLLNVTDLAWRIEKRNAATGALDTSFDNDGFVDSNTGASGTPENCRAIAIDSTHLYVGGIGGTQWRIEKRRLDTGALDTAFDGDGIVSVGSAVAMAAVNVNGVYGLAHDGTWLYAAGTLGLVNWTIEKRSLATGALDTNFGTGGVVSQSNSSQMRTFVMNGSSLYVAGRGTNGWVIQKRSLTTGALDSSFGNAGEVAVNLAFPAKPEALALDGTSLYVAGDNNGGWRLEKRNLSDGALDGGFDDDGIIEFDPSGNAADQPWGIAVDGADLYVCGTDYAPGNGQWRIEKRSSSTGALVLAFDGDGFSLSNPSGSTDSPKPVVLDATSVTVGGFQVASGATGVRFEKRTR